jgi:hypothetical protein
VIDVILQSITDISDEVARLQWDRSKMGARKRSSLLGD